MTTMAVRHVILDRDGVLNEEAPGGGYIRDPGMWRWLPGALEGLSTLNRIGMRISIATNQSGIGRGLMTEQDLERVHQRMKDDAAAAGVKLEHLFVCMHAPEHGCTCRKPAPGLIERAVRTSNIPREQTLVVGDDVRDLEAARAAGVRAVLVMTGKGSRAIPSVDREETAIYENLDAFAASLDREADRQDAGQR